VFGFYNKKKEARNTPYFLRFLDYKIRIGEKLIFFHPNSNYKIRKSHEHFRKKKKDALEMDRVEKVITHFLSFTNLQIFLGLLVLLPHFLEHCFLSPPKISKGPLKYRICPFIQHMVDIYRTS